MAFGDSKLIKQKGTVRLLEVEAKYGRVNFCVLGKGKTNYYEDYDDALEEFNFRWLKQQFDS